MTRSENLKIAFAIGVDASVSDLSEEESSVVKEAVFRSIGRGLRRLFGMAPKLAPNATKQEIKQFAKEQAQYAYKKLLRKGFDPFASVESAQKFINKAGPKAEEWLSHMREVGKNPLTRGTVSYLLPAGVGAGVGYAVGGRQGAIAGAGLGLGARLGMSGFLPRLEEARGFYKMMGKNVPNLTRQMLGTAAGKKALIASGILAPGLGTLGYMAGRRPEPKRTVFSGLGLTPQQTQQLGQLAMPLLSERLGLDPALVQGLAEQYGLVPEQTSAPSIPETLFGQEAPSGQYDVIPEEYLADQYGATPQYNNASEEIPYQYGYGF